MTYLLLLETQPQSKLGQQTHSGIINGYVVRPCGGGGQGGGGGGGRKRSSESGVGDRSVGGDVSGGSSRGCGLVSRTDGD